MMSERDSVTRQIETEISPGKILFITSSIEREDAPLRKGIIRIRVYDASIMEQDGNDLKMTKFSNFDMGGYFPVRLLNMMIAATN